MQIHIDMPINALVKCLDGKCGQSLELVVNPEDQQVTHLVVKDGTRKHSERIIPIGMISGTSEDTIHLCCNKDDLMEFDIFCEKDVVLVSKQSVAHGFKGTYYIYPVSRQIVVENKSIPEGGLSFDHNTVIEATDGRLGKLEKLLINPETEKITHFVVSNRMFFGPREVNIPISAIDHFSRTAIYFSLSKKQVKDLQQIKSLP